jgi:hypothetical protein
VTKNASSKAPSPQPEPGSSGSDIAAGQLVKASPAEIRAYISQMTGELAVLARAAKLGTLAYLLEMARDEAKGGR